MAESKTSVRRLKAIERQKQALELRATGKSYDYIAAELGYASASGAYSAVEAAILRTQQEPADHVRVMELRLTDKLLAKLVDRLDSPGSLPASDLRALTDSTLRVMDRRAKYLGIDQPVKVAPTDPTGEHEYTGQSDSEAVRTFVEILSNQHANGADPESG